MAMDNKRLQLLLLWVLCASLHVMARPLNSIEEMITPTKNEVEYLKQMYHLDIDASLSPKQKRKLENDPNELTSVFGSNCELRNDYDIPRIMTFLPAYKGKVHKVGDTLVFTNTCFRSNSLTLSSIEKGVVTLTMTAEDKDGFLCNDMYMLFTSTIQHVKVLFLGGVYQVRIENLTQRQLDEITVNGLRVFSFCDNIYDTLISLYKTAVFMKTNPQPSDNVNHSFNLPQFMTKLEYSEIEESHIDFLERYVNLEITRREGLEDVVLPVEQYIQSGDFLGLHEIISGESCIIQYGSYSAVSHSAIAIRDPDTDELLVAEIDDRGFYIRPWAEFIEYTKETHHGVVWFPLREEFRSKFDTRKALAWINQRIGMKYGQTNFIIGAIDTLTGNFPKFLSIEHLMLAVSVLEKFNKVDADDYLLEALNVRMGTNGQSLEEVTHECVKRNKTLEEVFIMPELEEYVYKSGENWVCSAIVVKIWMEGGMLDGYKLEPHEFTPRDVYQMDIYDKEFYLNGPEECKMSNPGENFCMIYGKYYIKVEGHSSIPLYDHMNERCSGPIAGFEREEGC